MARFENRRQGGRALATALQGYAGRSDTIVLALPRGGVPVGYEVARRLGAPLDVFVVRKLGVPGHEELAMGAIGSGGVVVLNHDVLDVVGVDQAAIDRATAVETKELRRRERVYRGARPPLDVAGKTVILVDDGLATGSTMRAAVASLRKLGPARIVVGVPVSSPETCQEIGAEVDDIACAITPEPFDSVGLWYDDFEQTADAEVQKLLAAAERGRAKRRAASPRQHLCRAIADTALPLRGVADEFESERELRPLLELAGDASCVLLGESTHGTHEFYRLRAQLTKELILRKGFSAVAVEADWPDAYRVNRYVRGLGADGDAVEALAGFRRFPAWMWRNADVLDFVGWLRTHNDALAPERKVGFYGLDLYSLHASIDAVLQYLDRVEPDAARRARQRYECFEAFGQDPAAYGRAAEFGLSSDCRQAVVQQLIDLEQQRDAIVRRDGLAAEDEQFQAEQNARVVWSAERYYRAMFADRIASWNLRDTHMADTLDALLEHLGKRPRGEAKVVVWAHNSHLGDARATQMGEIGEINLGQLARERHQGSVVSIGFTTYSGTVTAASNWGASAERKRVRNALPDSYEALFHEAGIPSFALVLRDLGETAGALREPHLERAIGVIYRPDSERGSHYFRARLPEQFDAVIHVDETRALEPLERTAEWDRGELPETYPAGL